jgi:hypothetical protein
VDVDPDTLVYDLRGKLGGKFGIAHGQKIARFISYHGRIMPDTTLIHSVNPNLEPVFLRSARRFPNKAQLYCFRHAGSTRRFDWWDSPSVSEAIPKLASELKVAASAISIWDSDGRCPPGAKLDKTFKYSIRFGPVMRAAMQIPVDSQPPHTPTDSGVVPRTFVYEGREIQLDLSLETTFTDVKTLVAPHIGEGVPFDILWDDADLDDDKTIGDMEECTRFIVSRRTPQPVVSSNATYTLYYYIGEVLRPIQLAAPPGATLADIEGMAKSIAQLAEAGTEFVLRVGSAANLVTKTTRLDCPDLMTGKVIIRPSSTRFREIRIVYLTAQIPCTVTASETATLRELEPEIRRKFKLGERPIGFALLNEDCEIEKRLPPETVVGDLLHSPQMMMGVVEDVSGDTSASPRTDTAIPFRFRLMEDDAEAFTPYFEPEQRIGDV